MSVFRWTDPWTRCAAGMMLALPIVFTASVTADSPVAQHDDESTLWRMTRLDLDLAIGPDKETLTGKATLHLQLDGAASVGPTIEIGEAARLLSVSGPDGAECTLSDDGQLARVRFSSPRQKGNVVEVDLNFRNEGQSFQLAVGPDAAYASWACAWYPSPLRGSESAVGITRISVPPGWKTIANGRLIESSADGDQRTDTWEATAPMARSFAAAPYNVTHRSVGGREVGAYLLAERPKSAARYAETLARILAAQEARFGPYPYNGYAVVEVPTAQWAGSSEQGFFMARSDTLSSDTVNVPLFAHELCHGWWGNSVPTKDPSSLMVSEALAQYGAVVAIEAIEGRDAATRFLEFSRAGYNTLQCAKGFFNLWRRGHDKPLMLLTGEGQDHNLSDAKGHWVYHMLRRRIGDELFFSRLRSLARNYAGKRMSLQDLRDAFVKAAPPERDVPTFFREWLDRPGAPILDVEWEPAKTEGRDAVRVTIQQRTEPYHLNLDIAVRSARGDRLHTVKLDRRTNTFVLEAPGAVTGVDLDPEHKLLMWRPEYGPRPEL